MTEWTLPAAAPVRWWSVGRRLPGLLGRLVLSLADAALRGAPARAPAAQRLLDALGVRVVWEGDSLPLGPAVYVANHLGWLDPLVLAAHLPADGVAKREVAGWPGIGGALTRMGALYVDRDRPLRARVFVNQAVARLRAGGSVVGFPEGSSSDHCRVLPFKTGLFAAAIEAGAPVVPIRIDLLSVGGRAPTVGVRQQACWYGAKELLPHLLWTLGAGGLQLRVTVGRPIVSSGWSRKALARFARHRVLRWASDQQGSLLVPNTKPPRGPVRRRR